MFQWKENMVGPIRQEERKDAIMVQTDVRARSTVKRSTVNVSVVQSGFNTTQLQQHFNIVAKCHDVIVGIEKAGLKQDRLMVDAKQSMTLFVEFSRSVEEDLKNLL